jgi:hypothetical protein
MTPIHEESVRDAFRAIIDGKTVKRAKHLLVLDGRDLTEVFISELQRCGYRPRAVDQVHVEPGARVPAFYLSHQTAYFGWVFWEQFTTWKLRKLWGSVIKNKKGDWDIQLVPSRREIIYANELLKLTMDIDHPAEF